MCVKPKARMSSTRPPKPVFKLTLEALPRPDGADPAGTYRLKGALKSLLRAWGLRCIEVAPVKPDQDQEAKG